jgi:hypothetical protein
VLHIVAEGLDEAREQFIDALHRDRADRGLQAATAGAHVAVAGLVAEGPVKVVNGERARLLEAIATAERQAARWEHAAALLATQSQTHAREEASGRADLSQAEAHLTAVRDHALRPLLSQATADGQAYLDTHRQHDAAWDATRSTNRLGRRAARRRLDAAQAEAHDAQATVVNRWGSVPDTGRWAATTRDGLEAWAARVAHQRTEAQPVLASARQHVARAGDALKQIRWRHRVEAEELTIGVYDRRDAASIRTVSGTHSAQARAQRWREYADTVRADLTHIESLPIGRAVHYIESSRARALEIEVEQAAATHGAGLGAPTQRRIGPTDPERGLSI